MDPIDWQMGKTPIECTRYMLENQHNCDVNFKVGENEENIKAHKLILSMRSAVFEKMFNGSFCESVKDPVIPDVTSAAFRMLLRYCYYECLDIGDDVALSVLYAAKKYMLPLLEEAARMKLIQILGCSNVWDVYKYAVSVGDTEIDEACKMYFEGDVTPVRWALQDEAFLNIPHEVLLDFLHINDKADKIVTLNENPSDIDDSETAKHVDDNNISSVIDQLANTLSLNDSLLDVDDSKTVQEVNYKNYCGISTSEVELFEACNAWAEVECVRQEKEPSGTNKRNVLGEALMLIRCPTMLHKDLANVVYPTGILTPVEIVNLCQYKHKEPGSECQMDFPSRERQFVVTMQEVSLKGPEISTVFIDSKERVMFSRLWVLIPGSYRVTVKNETFDRSWSMTCDIRYMNHRTKAIGATRYYLYVLDVIPQLLESGTKYSITAERIHHYAHAEFKHSENIVVIGELSPFEEVKAIGKKANTIYALTLCLV